ncbi:MAG: ATP-dependent DNA helicase RecG [Planctomycetes bacterium]|nr:ATP-dependent DNA helicase RecG [Planctomycetota bacterium]
MPDAITAKTRIADLPGLNPRLVERLSAFELRTAGDLVRHFPMRHERRLAERTIAQTEKEVADEQAVVRVRGTVAAVKVRRGRGAVVEATLEDESGSARLMWFNAGWMRDKIHPGDTGVAEGKAKIRNGFLELGNPRWIPDRASDEAEPKAPKPPSAPAESMDRLRAVYPASEQLLSSEIELAVGKVLQPVCATIEDPLPSEFRQARGLIALAEAYRLYHDARDDEDVAAARKRLAYDELFLLQLGVMMRRAQLRSRTRAIPLKLEPTIDQHIRARIPFTLTAEQDRVIGEIAKDMGEPFAMNRLLQGDVGSGKTAVAVYAMLLAVAHGHQAALVAPTEILAEQHYAVLRNMLKGSQVRIAFVTGSNTGAERMERVAGLATGKFDIAIGTHALLESGIAFRSLAVAVIDEQHRFGVKQRAAIRQKGQGELPLVPHTLVMTATPIPRTLAITLYGDLDTSVLRGMPPGRTRVITRVVTPEKAPEVYAYLRTRLDRGEQAYVVVPAIEESDLGLKDVANHVRYLQEGPWKGIAISCLHGAMTREDREANMKVFRSGAVQALVATIIIEVGVDIPNASIMVVEHADRFGLAQLHQLRGRVGRGATPSLCVFLGDAVTTEGKDRLAAIGATDDGFEIAETDLRIRGPGEVFGSRQSGLPPFQVADLTRDAELLGQARQDAKEWIDRDPELAAAGVAALKHKLMLAYGKALGLGDVG